MFHFSVEKKSRLSSNGIVNSKVKVLFNVVNHNFVPLVKKFVMVWQTVLRVKMKAWNYVIKRGKFSDLASKTCVKRNTYNATITVKAVPCNGIEECEDGSDEDNCFVLLYVEIYDS